jgi:Zn-dependent M28 family amino/carboxypeptidase
LVLGGLQRKEECSLDLKERLQTYLSHVVRERDPYLATEGHFYVREYIREELGKWGEVDTGTFLVGGRKHQNLQLNLPERGAGGGKNKPIILIGAHYDAVPGSPGADDNATGVAVLLEFARMFAREPANYPIRLVAFDMEEFGLEGSHHCAAELKEQGQKNPADAVFGNAGVLRFCARFAALSGGIGKILPPSGGLYCADWEFAHDS